MGTLIDAGPNAPSDTQAAYENKNLIITVKEMRKLMGKDCEGLTDSYIEQLIMLLTETSSMLLNHQPVPKKRRVSVQ